MELTLRPPQEPWQAPGAPRRPRRQEARRLLGRPQGFLASPEKASQGLVKPHKAFRHREVKLFWLILEEMIKDFQKVLKCFLKAVKQPLKALWKPLVAIWDPWKPFLAEELEGLFRPIWPWELRSGLWMFQRDWELFRFNVWLPGGSQGGSQQPPGAPRGPLKTISKALNKTFKTHLI